MRISPRGAIIGAATLALIGAAAVPAMATTHEKPKPTVVLVHGAFADSSSWTAVTRQLRKDGYPVRAIANPLRGIASDAAYVSSFLKGIDGPIVLVGHSYGGAVIDNAAVTDPDVKSLVFIGAYVPAKGETLGELNARVVEHPVPALPVVPTEVPGGVDLSIDPAQFRAAFAADVDKTVAADMAIAQRPISAAAFGEPSAAAAYTTIPSWTLITRNDQAIAPDLQRFMAARAKATVTEVNASHAVMVSKPSAVTKIIEQAAR
ncbi:alpha/beta fold hydrolase [Actinoplanes palleronii]|uniref:Alpha/beta hydrolase n=1 Tax=Actinoplanes palleronii TaxID=113570 RepID=A0ABQ4B123_9ACTN|nr:alpha/beta hydrolase [Actinoplanes palleronii]GIE64373.1 alpha/beta hydrolase [Actinoplanes palleronii]